MINRLVEPTSGLIELGGKNISEYDIIELRRNIGYVIQSIGLFPHMTIEHNIGIIPELIKWPKEKVAQRVEALLSMIGLEPDIYKVRYPAELSGGQQQRIGVARALAADPPVILMDEPFGALDPITREQLQNELLGLIRKIKKTIVFVTHDIFEAIKLADRLALMDKGRIIQIGSPKEIIEEPANEYVIDFLGKHHFQLSLLMTRLGDLMIATDESIISGKSISTNSLRPDDSILDALNYLKNSETEEIPIRDNNNRIQGIVSKNAVRNKIFEDLL
jgi:osmoprotectant transport system ATP-binding protein